MCYTDRQKNKYSGIKREYEGYRKKGGAEGGGREDDKKRNYCFPRLIPNCLQYLKTTTPQKLTYS
jgi:hypothetical protein